MATQASNVTTALTQKYWDTKLVREIQTTDIFSNYVGPITNHGQLPNQIVAQKHQKGKTTGTMGFIKSLSGAGVSGLTGLSGSEESMVIRDQTIYANEFKWGVENTTFGAEAVANSPYGLLGLAGPLLIEYMEKNLGKHRRQSLVEKYSYNLTGAPSSRTLGLNSNIWVGGVALASQPAYVDTLATYQTAVNTAIPDSPTSANRMTAANVKLLEDYTRVSAKLEPFAGGRYIVTVPAGQKSTLMDEDTGLLKHFSSSSQPEKALKGWIGSYMQFDFVEDLRSPVLLATDGASSSLTWTYVGADDSRPALATDQWDVGFVLGKGAICELVIEKQHFETDDFTEYGREEKLGAFADYGCNANEFQDGTDAKINQGSIVVLWNRNA